jgi:hypothetical protein
MLFTLNVFVIHNFLLIIRPILAAVREAQFGLKSKQALEPFLSSVTKNEIASNLKQKASPKPFECRPCIFDRKTVLRDERKELLNVWPLG